MLGEIGRWVTEKRRTLDLEFLQRGHRIEFDHRCGAAPGRMIAGLRLALDE
jgi:hypothetical protein